MKRKEINVLEFEEEKRTELLKVNWEKREKVKLGQKKKGFEKKKEKKMAGNDFFLIYYLFHHFVETNPKNPDSNNKPCKSGIDENSWNIVTQSKFFF